ncbi:MAG: sulfatase-like hydrolase/transferase [Isosphaeraceae bacterium]
MTFFRKSALLAACLSAVTLGSARAQDRPNIVLIVADDLGWADLGCYGSRFHRTPNLDKLAAEGRRFTQAYAAAPVCSPTRAALMTGRHPARLHLTDWLPGRPDRPDQKMLRPELRTELPADAPTIAERLKSAGYDTAHIGKWHLGGKGFEPTTRGFGLNVAGDDLGSPLSYFAPFKRGDRFMPGLQDAPEGQYLTDRLADEAVKYIDQHRSKPFFLYLPHYSVHTPLRAKEDMIASFPKWDGTPHGRQENPIYAAMLESLDQAVGRLVEAVEKAGLTQKTVILFTSDNGGLATREGPNTPATNNSPLREGKGYLYEGGLRVPLIVWAPGRVKPGVEVTPVWSADVSETVRALGGAERAEPSDGVALDGLLLQGKAVPARPLYWHYPHYSNQGGRPGGAVRDGDWKLVEFYDSGRRELFNVKSNFQESNNLAQAQPKKVAELAQKLDRWRKSVGAVMPATNPDYHPNVQDKSGVVTLPASTADVHGVMLRYEPLPHKNTLGFWVSAGDWASFEFETKTPGKFRAEALVGCGNGSGGSLVEFLFDDQPLTLSVAETGGFQAFKPQDLGEVTLDKPGRHRLEVRVRDKPKFAVMDLRQVKLVPVKD